MCTAMCLTLLTGSKDKYISRPFSKRNPKDNQRLCGEPTRRMTLLNGKLPRAVQTGVSRTCRSTRTTRSLLFVRGVFLRLQSFSTLSFINFMDSFKSTEQSRFCSFARLTLNVVWNYQPTEMSGARW